jgi:hypothetical protein
LNQKATIHIWDDTFYYYIETFLKLPYYSERIKDWIRKKIDSYILKLLKKGKIVKKSYSDKILQNIEKNIKNRSYKQYFLKGFNSILLLLSEKQKAKWLLGNSNLKFKKTEIPSLHNLRLMVNGNLVILTRDINRFLGNGFRNVEELFYTFLELGLEINNINIRDITTLELVSYEIAKPLIQFDKSKHPDIRVLEYGKNFRRHLANIGYENYYDYIDYSREDDYGNKKPEYEIQYINRKQKTIPEAISELDSLLIYKPNINNGIIEIQSFDI